MDLEKQSELSKKMNKLKGRILFIFSDIIIKNIQKLEGLSPV